MKKVKIRGKLDLEKMTIAQLTHTEANDVVGGKGFLSIGKKCTKVNGGCSGQSLTCSIWCQAD